MRKLETGVWQAVYTGSLSIALSAAGGMASGGIGSGGIRTD